MILGLSLYSTGITIVYLVLNVVNALRLCCMDYCVLSLRNNSRFISFSFFRFAGSCWLLYFAIVFKGKSRIGVVFGF